MANVPPLYGENIYICIFRQWGGSPSHHWCLLRGVCVERGYPSGYLCLLQLTTVAFTIMVVSMCIVARGRLTFIIKCTAIRCLQPWAIPRYSSGPRTAYRLRYPIANSKKGHRKMMIYSM